MKDLLEDAKAELYEAEPDGFTARRQELAEGARDAGEPAVAKQIAALRKPTRSAWVVNRLVRSDPERTVPAGRPGGRPARGGRRRPDQGADHGPGPAGRRAHPDRPGRGAGPARGAARGGDRHLRRGHRRPARWPAASARWSAPSSTPDSAPVSFTAAPPGARPGKEGQGPGRGRGRTRGPPPGKDQFGRTGLGSSGPYPEAALAAEHDLEDTVRAPGSRARRRPAAPGRGAAEVLPGRVQAAARHPRTRSAPGVNHPGG